ncbi:LANO_0G11298g1_1 [Lachancea nothofagi CBS 11611]|uniref:LANO_0G11298g1_1 n=1 Tax=Lachancea nothofagi CBS 11611 TaxID=1266666 RepID=A0A1G4KJR6_9SACH|nr:LANO_0G11298g1_1 [Lachancea nothofagi CBS 11611]
MSKVLVLRTNVESFDDVLSKLKNLNQKSGPFDCALVLGKLLESTKDAETRHLDLPTFFTNSTKLLMEKSGSNPMGPNFTLLNGHGLFQMSHGLKIGYLSGDRVYLAKNRDQIRTSFEDMNVEGLDVLITEDCSKALITEGSFGSENDSLVDDILKITKPKYHFATQAQDAFLESAPFKWGNSELITRCLNIAEFNSGAKWAYAFNVNDAATESQALQKSLGPNPYEVKESRKRGLDVETLQESTVTKKPKQILPEDCRFCFSNPSIEDHLIIHIGEYAYLTIAKGPLTIPTNNMDFSGHCLLIPIKHTPKLKAADISSDNIFEAPFYQEIQRFEAGIVRMNEAEFAMSTVAFEINSENSIHYHRQLFPVAGHLVAKFESALERQVHFNNTKYSNNANLNFLEFSGTDNEEYRALINDSKLNYLQFTVYEAKSLPPKVYVATFKPEERIDLQFGRRVVAFVLRLPKRAKWDSQVCRQTIEQEKREVSQFQLHFKSYESDP